MVLSIKIPAIVAIDAAAGSKIVIAHPFAVCDSYR